MKLYALEMTARYTSFKEKLYLVTRTLFKTPEEAKSRFEIYKKTLVEHCAGSLHAIYPDSVAAKVIDFDFDES